MNVYQNIHECLSKYSWMFIKIFMNVYQNIHECLSKYSWMFIKISGSQNVLDSKYEDFRIYKPV